MKKILLLLLSPLLGGVHAAAQEPPATLMTTRGKLLASEDFDKPLLPPVGKAVGFASGFTGWRFNAGPTGGKTGRWELAGDGTFKGIETPGAKHPATASFGIRFKDAIIQCEVRLNDVPEDGRQYRTLAMKVTDAKDYLVSFSMGLGGAFLVPYDAERIDPKSKQRMRGKPLSILKPGKLNEWHTLVLEIWGDEVVGTLDGKSTTLSNALIGADKHSVMLVAGTEASFRHFRMWEALPNPAWPKNKAALIEALNAAPQKAK